MRRATLSQSSAKSTPEISIHALLAESDVDYYAIRYIGADISIHALLAESDGAISQLQCVLGNFYPRSPCGERRMEPSSMCMWKRFLSTLSLRRATSLWVVLVRRFHDFYPRSPCGERPQAGYHSRADCPHFYPRSPCGERRSAIENQYSAEEFLSTLSLRRATPFSRSARMMRPYFYPRSPCGERPKWGYRYRHCRTISIHALLAESDPQILGLASGEYYISIHALLAESDSAVIKNRTAFSVFLSTLSLRRAT